MAESNPETRPDDEVDHSLVIKAVRKVLTAVEPLTLAERVRVFMACDDMFVDDDAVVVSGRRGPQEEEAE